MNVDCPSCGTALAAQVPPVCPACAVPLGSPVGLRLLALDRHIAGLDAERRLLLEQLRGMRDAGAVTGGAAASPMPAPATMVAPGSGAEVRSDPLATALASLRAAGPQALLAAGGVLLLVIAALVFTAVAWRDLPVSVRGGLLVVASAGCGVVTHRLATRGLARTAEATAVLTVALLAVLVNGLWRAGAFDGVADGAVVLGVTAAALAGLSHLLAGLTRTRSPHVLAAWLAPIAVLSLGLRLTNVAGSAAWLGTDTVVGGIALLAAAAVAVVYAQRYLAGIAPWRTVTRIAAAVLWVCAAIVMVIEIANTDLVWGRQIVALAWCVVVTCLAVAAALVMRRLDSGASRWDPAGAAGAWLMATCAGAALLKLPPSAWQEARFLIPALGAAAALWLLPTRRSRYGAVAGMVPVATAGAMPLLWSLSWLIDIASTRVTMPWTADAGLTIVVAPGAPTVVLAAAAVAVIAAVAAALDRRILVVIAGVGAAVVVVGAALLMWPAGGGVIAAAAIAAAGAIGLRGHASPAVAVAALVSGTLLAVALGLSGQAATIAALVAATTAAGAVCAPIVTGQRVVDDRIATITGALVAADAIGLVAAVLAAMTHAPGPVGVAVAVASAGVWFVAGGVGDHRQISLPVEVTGAVGFATGLALAARADAAAWLAVAFAVLAAAATVAVAQRSDRPWMGWVAKAAASASSWTVLADLGVDVVEAYTVPPALLLLAIGAIALRQRSTEPSWQALGAGLGLLLTPTVAMVLDDPDDLGRLAAVIVVGSALAVAGRVWRLQAPLVSGVAALIAVALTQYDVVTAVVPRWLLLAAGGSLLLWLSISYERQLQRLAAVRAGLAGMR